MSSPDKGLIAIGEVGERALIEAIRRRSPAAAPFLVVGIGDDAAVAVPDRGALQVLTTDALVEGVHFDRRYSSPADIGYKAVAVNVSDIAAMGASPRLALLSLMLPPALSLADFEGLVDGVFAMAAEASVALAGGNISSSPGPLVVDVTVTGAVRPRRVLTRTGGRPGDVLYVSGSLGGAAAGLDWLRTNQRGRREDPGLGECVECYRRPQPRFRLGTLLGRTRTASACMDLSDGLADGVSQVALASGTGARIDAATLPLHPSAAAWFAARGRDAVEACVSGGDDYELLFAVPKRAAGRLRHVIQHSRGVPITRIGELTADAGVWLLRDGRSEPMPLGFRHFDGGARRSRE